MLCERCGKRESVWTCDVSHKTGSVDEDVHLCKKCTTIMAQDAKAENSDYLIIAESWKRLVPHHKLRRM